MISLSNYFLLPQGSEPGSLGWALTPEFAADDQPIKLFSASASDDLTDFLHILADARNGVAAGDDEGDECENDNFLHTVPKYS
jgi:hypothetical protein